jgi:putative aldouronate transport system substrate-binding protein
MRKLIGRCRKEMKKLIALMLVLAMTAVLGACSTPGGTETTKAAGGTTKTEPKESAQTQSKPLEFSFMMAYWTDQPPQLEGNYLFEKFQEMLNVKIDLTLFPSANYTDKVMLKLASGDLPDVMWVSDKDVKTKAVVDAVEAGAFWDCTDLLNNDEYPNLKKAITSIMIANASIHGRVYGMPGPRPSARNGLFYRKDLFNKYSIPVPNDIDSFYEAAKSLKKNIPDIVPYSFQEMVVFFLTCSQGGYNGWGLKDGKIVPAYDTPEYKNTLNVLRKMYAEDLMNKDFTIVTGTDERALFIAGKAGMISGTYDSIIHLKDNLLNVVPDAEIGLVPVFNGTTNAQVGSAVYFLNKKMDKAKRDGIFRYFDSSLEQDILMWEYYGEENRHYKWVNGLPEYISEEASLETQNALLIFRSCAVNPVVIHWPGDDEFTKAWKKATEDYADAATRDYSSPLLSETQVELGAELNKIITDARNQYIMGIIDEAAFDAAVAEWYKRGGSKIAEEFTAAYKKSIGQ